MGAFENDVGPLDVPKTGAARRYPHLDDAPIVVHAILSTYLQAPKRCQTAVPRHVVWEGGGSVHVRWSVEVGYWGMSSFP